jgi:tetratricopeptide (TPR) repeat protein
MGAPTRAGRIDDPPYRQDGDDAEHQRCLEGLCVALTGAMISMTRAEAIALVRRYGGRFSSLVTADTSLLVVGEQGWPLKPSGRLTNKLQHAQKLRQQGRRIEILGEESFLQRVGLHQRAESVCRSYSLVELVRLLGVSRRLVQSLVTAGLVKPLADHSRLARFDFRQVSRVRSVLKLIASGTAVAKVRRSLEMLARCLPQSAEPLDWLDRLEVQEKRIVVRSAVGELLEPSGQMLLDFSERTGQRSGEATLRFQRDRFAEAIALEDQDRLAEAVAVYRAMLVEEGPDVAVCFNLANVLYAVGQKAAAAERFRQVVETDPEFVEAWNNLGNVLAELRQPGEAIAAVRRAVEIDASYADAQYALADLLEEAGRTEEAIPHWRAYLALEAQGPHADYARGRLASRPSRTECRPARGVEQTRASAR